MVLQGQKVQLKLQVWLQPGTRKWTKAATPSLLTFTKSCSLRLCAAGVFFFSVLPFPYAFGRRELTLASQRYVSSVH